MKTSQLAKRCNAIIFTEISKAGISDEQKQDVLKEIIKRLGDHTHHETKVELPIKI